ncbi:two-component system response regulator TorR, partial [Salmonella enterica subsp. enterica serovar Oslo]|nr:two-component system response regulator TorR [Salmonella enterica subsp. enterica serovar Oslo]
VVVRRVRHKIPAELLVTQLGDGYFLASEVY